MELVELVRMSAFDLGRNGANLEFGVLVAVGVLVLALLIAKARRAYLQKMRRAASAGYYDYDVARYGGGAPGRSLIEATESAGPQSVSSTFSAPKRGSRRKDRSPSIPPIPAPPSLHPPNTAATFASAPPPPPGSAPLQTAPSFASAPLPPPPSAPPSLGDQDGEGSALPLLVPPPPPASQIPPPPSS